MSSVCIIVPCYNEAGRLPVDAFLSYIQQIPDVNFCFVNDGSTDKTNFILEDMRNQFPDRIDVQTLPSNKGKASAVQSGMLVSVSKSFDYIGFFDADLATPLNAIKDLTRTLDNNPALDLVMGSRIKHLGMDIRRNPLRHYVGRIIATVISNILKLPVYDTQCGAKVFRSGVVGHLFRDPFVSPWLFDVEILARLIQYRGRPNVLSHVVEQPLKQWIEQSDSRISSDYISKIWYELYRIQRTYRHV
ncbi:glycosyltransferase [Spirosoma terrae]|uniref:Glycosyltransferase n=1 Tax=Spirosoma terrae TaxID=1968276 RepID=A0A6L9L4Y1_9BACT|nr:glycosyltransferase [Spirosoma terrae]NDU95544.1 glycosyltransferase [Spirosoma terrae]